MKVMAVLVAEWATLWYLAYYGNYICDHEIMECMSQYEFPHLELRATGSRDIGIAAAIYSKLRYQPHPITSHMV